MVTPTTLGFDNISLQDGQQLKTTPSPEPLPPCPPEVQENGVCPPTDEITPVPQPPLDCPEAGPELCGDEPPPGDGLDSSGDGSDNDNGGGNGNGNDNGNGEDWANGNGDDNEGEESGGTVPPFG